MTLLCILRASRSALLASRKGRIRFDLHLNSTIRRRLHYDYHEEELVIGTGGTVVLLLRKVSDRIENVSMGFARAAHSLGFMMEMLVCSHSAR